MRASDDPIHILYVGDEPSVVASSLEREDERFDVAAAITADEGMTRLADATVDCVVAEHHPPVLDGIAFLEAVHEADADLPLVLYADRAAKTRGADALADPIDYLQTGEMSDHRALATRIRNAVATPRDRDERATATTLPNPGDERAPLGVVEWDDDGRVARANATAAALLGYDEGDLPGTSWEALVANPEAATPEDLVAEFEDTDAARHLTETVRGDGDRILCEWHTRVVTDRSAEVIAVSQLQDVTDRAEQRRRLETLVDTLPGMVYRCRNEPGWPMEYVGGRVTELTGYSAAAVESHDVLYGTDVIHDADQDEVWRQVADALDRREPFELSYRIVTKDGETRWVWERGQGLYADGEVVALEGFVTDVTRYRETARALEAEREFVDQALDAMDDLFYVLDTDGCLERWNSHLEAITGYDTDALAGMDATELFPETDRDRIAEGIDEALLTGEVAVVETDLLTAEGDRIPHEFTGARLTDDEGEVAGLVGVGRDITERRQYEQRLSALHDVADDLTTVESVEAACRRTIEATQAILEFDLSLITLEEDGLLKPVAVSEELSSDGMAEMSVDEGIAGKTYRTGESLRIDDLRSAPDAKPQGSYRSVVSVPIGDRGNFQAVSETTGAFDEADLELAELLLTHTENALDRLDREGRLADRNEQLQKFAGVVSHDLRNPLNVVQGRLELAREEHDSEHLEPAARAVERCFAIIDDVLTLAREGTRVGTRKPVDLAALVEECWANVRTDDATLTVETSRTVRADSSRLTHVFENLLRNAVEHGGDDVTITVGDTPDGFYVADDGDGIPEADRETVFDAGYSSRAGGTGFGLSIVREIATAHGWEVRLTESEAGGVRFEFTDIDDEA